MDITDIHAEYLLIGKRNQVEKMLTPFLLRIEYWIIGKADRLIVATKAMKEHIVSKSINPEKIRVVYDTAEIDKISSEKEPGFRKNVIHLGGVDRQHNVEVFIKDIPDILKKHKDARFFVVGGGRELRNVISLAEELGIYSNCVFTDYLPCERARDYLKKSVIGVISRNENLPNRIVTTLKIYEYWASKTAVVSSRTEGITEIAEENRDIVFFRSGNFEELGDRICHLIENPSVADKIRKNGYNTTQKYTWEKIAPRIAEFSLEK